MKGKRNNPRGNTKEDGEGREEEEEEEELSSWTAFRGFVEFLRPWIESERGKGGKARERGGEGSKNGARNVASVSLSAKGSLYRGPLSGRWIAATSYCVSAPI